MASTRARALTLPSTLSLSPFRTEQGAAGQGGRGADGQDSEQRDDTHS